MTVKQLIDMLQAQKNQDAKVLLYCASSEDMEESPSGVSSRAQMTETSEFPYCKGDGFEAYNRRFPDRDYVVIE